MYVCTHHEAECPHMLSGLPIKPTPSLPELDALGDEFLAEEDSSYLDAVEAPDPPSGIPTEREKNKVRTT